METASDRASRIRNSVNLTAIAGEVVDLARKGREYVGCCPFHDDHTPSLYVNDERGLYHCFGCGASGDVIAFVMALDGLSFGEACDRLDDGYVPWRPPLPRIPSQGDTAKAAKRHWNRAVPIGGTIAERYLRNRGLPLDCLPELLNLRYAELSFDGSAALHPTLIAAVRTLDGDLTGIQRTYLTPDGRKLDPHNAKRSLGNIKGNAIWIHEDVITGNQPKHIYLTEGLEDGLSIARMFDDGDVWVAAGAGMLSSIKLPDSCRRVTICGDNDEVGQRAAESALRAMSAGGREVEIIYPDWRSKDWNDYLQFKAAHMDQITEEVMPWPRG